MTAVNTLHELRMQDSTQWTPEWIDWDPNRASVASENKIFLTLYMQNFII